MSKYEGAPEGPYTIATSGDCIGIFNSEGDMIADLTDCSYSKFTAPLFRDAPMLAEQVEELEGIVNTQRGTIENYYETTKKMAEQNAKMLAMLKETLQILFRDTACPDAHSKIWQLIAEIESANGTR